MNEKKVEQKITEFFSRIEREVQKMEYGTITVTVMTSNGLPLSRTTNLVKQKRIRYKTKS